MNSLNLGFVWGNSPNEKLWNHLDNREKLDFGSTKWFYFFWHIFDDMTLPMNFFVMQLQIDYCKKMSNCKINISFFGPFQSCTQFFNWKLNLKGARWVDLTIWTFRESNNAFIGSGYRLFHYKLTALSCWDKNRVYLCYFQRE